MTVAGGMDLLCFGLMRVAARRYSDVPSRPPPHVWVDPSVTVAPSAIEGSGLFATADLEAGRIVLRLGGRLVPTDELARLIAVATADPGLPYVDSVSVADDLHLVLPPGTAAHFGNHSCNPNLWHDGPYAVAARRPIGAGEELTIDFGTSSGAPGFSMPCRCGTAECRRVVTSDDWQIAALQARYRGHWVPVLEERIASIR
jgi:uncharacterized protein